MISRGRPLGRLPANSTNRANRSKSKETGRSRPSRPLQVKARDRSLGCSPHRWNMDTPEDSIGRTPGSSCAQGRRLFSRLLPTRRRHRGAGIMAVAIGSHLNRCVTKSRDKHCAGPSRLFGLIASPVSQAVAPARNPSPRAGAVARVGEGVRSARRRHAERARCEIAVRACAARPGGFRYGRRLG